MSEGSVFTLSSVFDRRTGYARGQGWPASTMMTEPGSEG
jgi:hypothetical protein